MGCVRAYREYDECDLVPRLRAADLQEIKAGSGSDPLTVLREGAEKSAPSCTIIGNNGFVAGMFGVVPEGDYGRVWMVGSDELTRRPLSRQFIKECRSFLSVLERPYESIGNLIDERNTVHMRWLEWMGFEFIDRIPSYGVEGRPFLEFKKHVRTSDNHGRDGRSRSRDQHHRPEHPAPDEQGLRERKEECSG